MCLRGSFSKETVFSVVCIWMKQLLHLPFPEADTGVRSHMPFFTVVYFNNVTERNGCPVMCTEAYNPLTALYSVFLISLGLLLYNVGSMAKVRFCVQYATMIIVVTLLSNVHWCVTDIRGITMDLNTWIETHDTVKANCSVTTSLKTVRLHFLIAIYAINIQAPAAPIFLCLWVNERRVDRARLPGGPQPKMWPSQIVWTQVGWGPPGGQASTDSILWTCHKPWQNV